MPFNLVLNKSNLVPGTNNTFRYQFKNGGFNVEENYEMTLKELTLPYSWCNVSATLGNNVFYYTMPSSSATLTASFSGNVMTVTAPSSAYLLVGSIITCTSFPAITSPIGFIYVSSFGTGSGGLGTYNLSQSVGTISSMSASNTGQTLYTVNLSDGFYQVSDINTALQRTMYKNGHFYAYYNTSVFTGSISGTTLTVSTSTNYFSTKTYIQGYGVTSCNITAVTGPNTYTVSSSQTVSSQVMIALTAPNTNLSVPTNIFPISITTNTSLYTNVINLLLPPVFANIQCYLGQGYYLAALAVGQPYTWPNYSNATNPSLILPPGIGQLLGFSSSSTTYTQYGAGTGTAGQWTTINGSITPQGSTVNAVIVKCDIINNSVANDPNILDALAITTTYGSNINYCPNYNAGVSMKPGTQNTMNISFFDQNLNPLTMQDQNIFMSVMIKKRL